MKPSLSLVWWYSVCSPVTFGNSGLCSCAIMNTRDQFKILIRVLDNLVNHSEYGFHILSEYFFLEIAIWYKE